MKKITASLLALAAATALGTGVVATAASGQTAKPAPQAQIMSARAVVGAAASAMGGVEKLNAIRNITAHGYGQYAYQMGGGRISGAPDAPEKYIGANELTRVYDLEHDRIELKERRNMLFPFLDIFGNVWAQTDTFLDGDVGFDMTNGVGGQTPPPGPPPPLHPVRIARWLDGQLMDGVHMRRMWMMNNPVVLLRAMMDPATKLSTPRRTGGVTVVDVTLKYGDKFSAAFGANHLPAWVRWSNPNSNLGETTLTTSFSGWVTWDGQGGVLMPLGYQTRGDWRNIDYFKMFVDAYDMNTSIPDLAAPAAIRNGPEPESFPARPVTSVKVDRGIWRLNNGTSVVEFKDYLLLYEFNVNTRNQAKVTLDYARNLAPGKPIKYLVASHNHFDHTVGLRSAVAAGITVIQRPDALMQFREVVAHPAPNFPDDLAKHPLPFKTITLGEHLQLKDETQAVDIYWGRNNGHMADTVFAYAPAQKVMMEGDMATAAMTYQHWADSFRDVIAYYHLDVQKDSPVHSVWREHPDVLTHAQVEEILSGGVKRAREHCADLLAKGVYHPGCPVQSKYY